MAVAGIDRSSRSFVLGQIVTRSDGGPTQARQDRDRRTMNRPGHMVVLTAINKNQFAGKLVLDGCGFSRAVLSLPTKAWRPCAAQGLTAIELVRSMDRDGRTQASVPSGRTFPAG